jgi:hypothetical protein
MVTPAAQPSNEKDASPSEEIAAVRSSIRERLRRQAELAWKTWALGEPSQAGESAPAADPFPSTDSFRKVEQLAARSVAGSDEARALGFLKLYLATEIAAREASEPSEALASSAATATLSVDGQELPFRDLDLLLAGEGHTGRRRKMAEAAAPVLNELLASARERDKRLGEALLALGYPGYAAFSAELRHADFEALAQVAEELLRQTEGAYRKSMEELARKELKLELTELRLSDIPRLFRTGDVDTFFPAEKMTGALTRTLAEMGLGPEKLAGLHLDTEPRPRKMPRALALPFEVPGDVRLSVKPASGLGAWAQTFHEAGHAVQLAATRAHILEFQILGDNEAGETLAALFEGLLDEPRFCAGLGLPKAKLQNHARVSALRRLYALRRSAGWLLFERDQRGQAPGEPIATYREVMGRAAGFPLEEQDAKRYLVEHADFFLPADLLRAQLLAGMLEKILVSGIGHEWWSDPRSGAKILELFAEGGRSSADELARAFGASGIDPAPLLGLLKARLDPSKS